MDCKPAPFSAQMPPKAEPVALVKRQEPTHPPSGEGSGGFQPDMRCASPIVLSNPPNDFHYENLAVGWVLGLSTPTDEILAF